MGFCKRVLWILIVSQFYQEYGTTCVFPTGIIGEWFDVPGSNTSARPNKTISFTDNKNHGFALPGAPVLENTVGTTYICVDNSSSKYVIRSKKASTTHFYVCTCLDMTHVFRKKLTFVQATVTGPGYNPIYFKVISVDDENLTVSRICDLASDQYRPDSYHVLSRNEETFESSTPATNISTDNSTGVPTLPSVTGSVMYTIVIIIVIVTVLAVAVVAVIIIVVLKRKRKQSSQLKYTKRPPMTNKADKNTIQTSASNEHCDVSNKILVGQITGEVYACVKKNKQLFVNEQEEMHQENPLYQTMANDGREQPMTMNRLDNNSVQTSASNERCDASSEISTGPITGKVYAFDKEPIANEQEEMFAENPLYQTMADDEREQSMTMNRAALSERCDDSIETVAGPITGEVYACVNKK